MFMLVGIDCSVGVMDIDMRITFVMIEIDFSREKLKNSLIVWFLCFLKNVWISSIGVYIEGGVCVRLRFDKCPTDEENAHQGEGVGKSVKYK
jgi:hypothetical protein